MFKNLFLLVAIGIVIWLVRRMLKNKIQQTNSRQSNEIKNIVQCHVCQAYIPEEKAINKNQLSFCSQQHADEWNENN